MALIPSIYPSNFEEKIGFNRIRNHVAELCLCPLGASKVLEAPFVTDFEIVEKLVEQVAEMKSICQMDNSFPADGYADATPFLERIGREGFWLDEGEIFTLRRSLDAIKGVLAYLRRDEKLRYPRLLELANGVDHFPFVAERIDSILNRFGKLKDNASPELARIRTSMAAKQASVSKRVASILKAAQNDGIVEVDAAPSVREGRIVIPVSAANKRKLKGIVQDESATGRTVFIEPVEVVELHNEIRELEYEERREILRILVEFADTIRPYLPELLHSYDFLGTIDSVRAKGLYALQVVGAKPILSRTPKVYLRKAVHPLLKVSLAREGREVVPLDMELKKENHILLISGPNAGGKSVCLKTVGITQYMLQCGFLPPVLENSELGIFNKIFIDIGDEQSIENDLSTYSSHLLSMKYFLRNADNQTLVLIDEFGSGTEPQAGGAIAESILQQLNAAGTFGVITTHYTNLKHYAASTDGVVNGAMLFDNAKLEPLFRLEMGKPGSSFAFEIARKIGLPDDVLKGAADKVGANYMSFEKLLREISRDKRYWEKKRDNIRVANKRTEELEGKLEEEFMALKQQRKEILSKAKEEARAIVLQANRAVENTIREIKETEADKERTRLARQQLEKVKDELKTETEPDDPAIARQMELIQQRKQRREERRLSKKGESSEKKPATPAPKPLEKGDRVRIMGQDVVGEIAELNPKNAVVIFGNILTSVPLKKLQRVSSQEYRETSRANLRPQPAAGFDLQTKRLNFRFDIDVRGYRVNEALEAVQDLVDEASMIGVSLVRILHGKGNGILRHEIRQFLNTMPFVATFADESEEFGGAGITVVKLE